MNPTIAVLGLGYVGLPLAVEFARHFDVIGFDIDCDRVAELARGVTGPRKCPPLIWQGSATAATGPT